MLILTNVMEHVVLETVEEILNSESGKEACHCERCRLDIAAIVLNNLSPAYVVTYEGEVKMRSYALIIQHKADIVREATKAMQTVATRVHHGRDNG